MRVICPPSPSVSPRAKLQNELARLKKRVSKADVLDNFKKSLADLKSDLRDENYDANGETSADLFLARLKDEQ